MRLIDSGLVAGVVDLKLVGGAEGCPNLFAVPVAGDADEDAAPSGESSHIGHVARGLRRLAPTPSRKGGDLLSVRVRRRWRRAGWLIIGLSRG